MILIVGLGNPGEKYNKTPHNVGFLVLDKLLRKMTSVEDSVWEENQKFNTFIVKVNSDLILAKPLSFMNSSGEVVQKLMTFYKIPTFGLFVVHDDIDLALGKIKISIDKGSAGHKGVESIMEHIGGKNFVRIRVGVGKDEKISAEKFVLSPLAPWEEIKLKGAIKKATEAIGAIIKEGVEKAATQYNQ